MSRSDDQGTEEERTQTAGRGCLVRRRVLQSAGSAAALALAGCTGNAAPTDTESDGEGDGSGGTATQASSDETTSPGGEGHEEELPEGVSREAFESGPVPDVYRTATSQGFEERHPDDMQAKDDAKFMEVDEARAEGLASEGQACENCADFIPDQNGDGFGACAQVEGYIGAEDWCALWEPIEMETDEGLPEGVSVEELVTGPVPNGYRTATSQGDEERDPDDLHYKAQVRFMEADEARAEGLASEGQACENCADFIPDQNGDGFGACAQVEGYIGAEDWCALWEPIEEGGDEDGSEE